jgi:surface polysaccharide O-acyltransferase-like enzyme
MCIGLIYLFRRFVNQQGRVASWFSRNAYTAYLIHEPLITSIALMIAGVTLYPLLKFALMGLVTVPLTFLLSVLVRKIPYADRVL